MTLPDTWSKGVDQEIVDLWALRQLLELGDSLLSEGLVVLLVETLLSVIVVQCLVIGHLLVLLVGLLESIVVSLLVGLDVADHIDVGLIDVP